MIFIYKSDVALNDSTIDHYTKAFGILKQTTIYPCLLLLFHDCEHGELSKDELTDILQFLMSYCIRRIVCDIPSNSLSKFFTHLYPRLIKNGKKQYYQTLFSYVAGLSAM